MVIQEGTNGVTGTEAALFTSDPGWEDARKFLFRYGWPNAAYFPVQNYVPAGSTIDSATLEVYVYEEYNTVTTNIECGYVTDPDNTGVWHDRGSNTEGSGLGATLAKKNAATSVYWNNTENQFTSVMSSMTCGQTNVQTTGWKSWDATTVAQGWFNGTYANRGFWLREASGANSNAWVRAKYYGTTSLRPKLTITYTPPANPPAGTLVLNTPTAGSQSVGLSWNSVSNADGYKVRYGTSSGNYTTTVTAGNTTQYTVTGLANGTIYYFVVAAYNSAGDGANSNEESETPFYAPDASTVVIQQGTNGVTGTEAAALSTLDPTWQIVSKLYFRWNFPNALYFPVAAHVPAGSTINSATLETYIYEEYNTGVTNVQCGYVTDPDNTGDWHDRGSGTDGAWLGATLNRKDAAVPVYWNNAQNQFTSVMSSTACGQANLQTTGWKSWNTTAVVQEWFDGTYANRGFWLREASGANSTAYAAAKYYGTTSLRPKLTITYTPPTPPPASAPVLNAPTSGSQSVGLSWNSVSDADGYKVKYGTTSGTYTTTVDVGNLTQHSVNDLTNGLTYYFIVTAYNSGGESGNSNEVSATPQIPPPASPVLDAPVAGNAEIDLTWDAVGTAVGYKVKYGTVTGDYTNIEDVGDVTGYTIPALTNGTTYYVVISAYNAGGESGNSNEVSATPQLPPPASPVLDAPVAGDEEIDLTWAAVDYAAGYKVKYGTVSGDYTGIEDVGNVTGYTIPALTNDTTYYIVVSAYNVTGESGNSNEVSATPESPIPADPVLSSATPGDSQVVLAWNSVSGATGYKVKYGIAAGNYTTTLDVNNVTEYTVPSLSNNTRYYFAVVAYSAAGDSGNSNELNAKPQGPGVNVSGAISANTTWTLINSPYRVTGDVTVNSGVTLTIEAGVEVRFTGNYKIEGNGVINAQGTFKNLIVFTWDTPGTTWSYISLRTGASVLDYVKIEHADTGVFIPFVSTTPTPEPLIQRSLIQQNNHGISTAVRTKPKIFFNTIINNNYGITSDCNDFGIKCAPLINNNSIYENAQYNLHVINAPSPTANVVINAENNWWGSTDLEEIAASIIDRADNPVLAIADYDPILRGPVGRPDMLSPPTLHYIAKGNQQLRLKWAPIVEATGYKIKYSTSSGVHTTTIDAGNITEYTVTGLTNGTPYYFVLTSYNAQEESAVSNELAEAPIVVTSVPATISANTTWTLANSPYLISSNVTVQTGVRLTIEPGVTVLFDGFYKIDVNGGLTADGTEEDPILFTSNRGPGTQFPADWQTVFLAASGLSSVIDHCRFEFAVRGLSMKDNNVPISHSEFEFNVIGLEITRTSTSSIEDNVFTNNTQYGILLLSDIVWVPQPVLRNNFIAGNGLHDLRVSFVGVNNNVSNAVIDAKVNWWGTDDPAQIALGIWDFNDENWRPRVDFDAYLVTPPGFLINITGNSVTPRFFNVRSLETTDVNYTLDIDADVTIKIYDYPANVLKRTLLNDQSRLAGANSEEWDGKDGNGVLLPKGSYIYKIDAQASGGKKGRYDPIFVPTPKPVISNVVITPAADFSPYRGDRLRIQYDIDTSAIVSLGATGPDDSEVYGTFVTAEPRDTTGNVDYWNGRNAAGNIVVPQGPIYVERAVTRLPVNVIVIQNKTTLDIATLKSDPYVIRPLYNEVTDITYTLNEAATVTLKIVTPDGNTVLKILETSVARSAGTYTLTWDGRTTAGETVAEEGDYRVRLEAVDSSGETITREGNVGILF